MVRITALLSRPPQLRPYWSKKIHSTIPHTSHAITMSTTSLCWTWSALLIFFSIFFWRGLKHDWHVGGLWQPRPVPICGFILWSCACGGAVLLMAEVLSDQEWLLAGWIPSQLFKKTCSHPYGHKQDLRQGSFPFNGFYEVCIRESYQRNLVCQEKSSGTDVIQSIILK